MDDNKINPELGIPEENNEPEAQVAENSQNVEVEENVSAENALEEPVQEPEADETAVSVDDTVEISENPVEENAEKPKKKKKKGKIAAIIILVALILAAAAAMVYVMLDTSANIDVEKTVLTVGDVDSDVGEFINVYGAYSYYASYYGFTTEQIKEYAIDELVAVNSYYSKAMEAGYTLTEEEVAEIDANIDSVKQGAESYSMTAEEYLESYICKDYTIDMYRAYLEKQYIAQKYYNDNLSAIDAQFTGDDSAAKVQEKYEADRTLYDLSDVSYWYFDSTEDNAQANADAIISNVNSGMSFEEAVKTVTNDSEAIPSSLAGYTKSVIESNFSADAAEWIFSIEDGKYTNGAGAVTTIEENSVIYVIYVNNEPVKNEAVPVTVDYISVTVSTDTSVKSESELKLAAKATATSILNEFEGGNVDADSFKSLRDSYINGDNELISGDVYEEMTADGSHDAAVEAWVFDEARQIGDHALVEGDGCYYILFFTAKNEHSVWYQAAFDALIEDAYNEWNAQITAEFEDKTVMYDDAIEEAIAYLNSAA